MALTTSLAAHWPLSDLTDSSGNGSTLTNNNATAFVAGRVGNGADFEDGSSNYLSLASNSFVELGDFDWTLCCWYKPETAGEGNLGQVLIGKTIDTPANAIDYGLEAANGSGRIRHVQYFTDSSTLILTAEALGTTVQSTWYFIVVEHDSVANTMSLWVNGVLQHSATTGGKAPRISAAPFTIGRQSYAGYQYYTDGIIDEVSIWHRKLTSAERGALYNAGDGYAFADWGFIITSEFGNGQVFQRSAGTNAKTITLSGTYSGTAPTTIEALINENGTATPVQAYTVLTNTTIGGGTWTGSLSVPAHSEWCAIRARSKDADGNVLQTGNQTFEKIGTGEVIGCGTQSNMSYMFAPTGVDPTANPLTSVYNANDGGEWAIFQTGDNDGAITFTDKIQQAAGVPVALIYGAIPGTGVSVDVGSGTWDSMEEGQPLPEFFAKCAAAGIDDIGTFWCLGCEADMYAGQPKQTIKDALTRLKGRLCDNFNRADHELLFLINLVGPVTDGVTTDTGAQNALEAVLKWINEGPARKLCGSARDAPLQDDLAHVHWAAPFQVTMGLRSAEAWKYAKGLGSVRADRPRASVVEWDGDKTITLTCAMNAGAELVGIGGGGGPSGFEVSADGGATWDAEIDSITVAGNTITIRLTETPAEVPQVRDQYGAAPDITNPVYDDTDFGDALGMPLLPLGAMAASESDPNKIICNVVTSVVFEVTDQTIEQCVLQRLVGK